MIRVYLLLSGFLLGGMCCYSQPDVKAKHNSTYEKLLDNAQQIKAYNQRIQGSPFFHPVWMEGEILTMDGHQIKKLKLKYDLHAGKLLCLYGNDSMAFEMDIIKAFKLTDATHYYDFGRIRGKSRRPKFKRGFYQILFAGNTKLLLDQKKKVTHPPNKEGLHFQCKLKYYVLFQDGRLKPIKPTRRHLLKVLQHRKYELRRYMEMHELNPNNQTQLTQLIEYYDSLI